MSAASLNHINIKAPAGLLNTCCDFYVEVVGLRKGYRPAFKDDGYWLYGDASEALIHMTITEDRTGGRSYFDHIAFNCDDLPGMLKRLKEHSVAFHEESSSGGKIHQIFFQDPCDLGVELNFKL